MVDLTLILPPWLTILIYFGMTVLMAIAMEGVAWVLHRFVMHGFGWYLHEDHHRQSKGRFEKNDLFAIFFSVLSCVLIVIGSLNGINLYFFLGIGVTCYGVGYFGFHDVLFHKRIRNKYAPKGKYMKRIFNAHRYHHQTTNAKGSGHAFGFLYAPKKYNVSE